MLLPDSATRLVIAWSPPPSGFFRRTDIPIHQGPAGVNSNPDDFFFADGKLIARETQKNPTPNEEALAQHGITWLQDIRAPIVPRRAPPRIPTVQLGRRHINRSGRQQVGTRPQVEGRGKRESTQVSLLASESLAAQLARDEEKALWSSGGRSHGCAKTESVDQRLRSRRVAASRVHGSHCQLRAEGACAMNASDGKSSECKPSGGKTTERSSVGLPLGPAAAVSMAEAVAEVDTKRALTQAFHKPEPAPTPAPRFVPNDFTYENLLRLDFSRNRRGEGLTLDRLLRLRAVVCDDNGGAGSGPGRRRDCAVCLEAFASGQRAVILPCGHAFCAACIGTWFREHRQCPICRKEVT